MRAYIAAIIVLTTSLTASAAESSGRDDAPPPREPLGAAAPVGTAERRIFAWVSVGTACADVSFAQSCLFLALVGVDLVGAELHVGALVGGQPHLEVGGLRAGGGWGTPWFKLTRRHEHSPYVLFMAVRNTVDFDFIGQGRGFTNFTFSHGIGPQFSLGLTRQIRLFARLGVGFSLVSATNDSFPRPGSVQPTSIGPTMDFAIGVQLFR